MTTETGGGGWGDGQWEVSLEQLKQNSQSDYEREPPPLRSEVEWALGNIANGKAPGMDDIPTELWKAAGEEGVDILWRI